MSLLRTTALSAALVLTLAGAARAGDAADIAREMKLPVPVVETTLANVDAFYASASGPANRLTSGVVKDLALKAIRHRMGNLEDSVPGKASESTAEEKNGIYKAVVKTTRHETTETRECVDNRVILTSSEALPVVKDGAFGFDTARPRVASHTWDLGFCRTPSSGGGFSDWAPAGR